MAVPARQARRTRMLLSLRASHRGSLPESVSIITGMARGPTNCRSLRCFAAQYWNSSTQFCHKIRRASTASDASARAIFLLAPWKSVVCGKYYNNGNTNNNNNNNGSVCVCVNKVCFGLRYIYLWFGRVRRFSRITSVERPQQWRRVFIGVWKAKSNQKEEEQTWMSAIPYENVINCTCKLWWNQTKMAMTCREIRWG